MTLLAFPTGAGPAGAQGPTGPQGPPGSAPTGTLAAVTDPNQIVIPYGGQLIVHDGSQAVARAMRGGGMCATGGALGATVSYVTSGPADVGVTGWAENVPLYPDGSGGMVPQGDPALAGTFSCACGTYDGQFFHTAIGEAEEF